MPPNVGLKMCLFVLLLTTYPLITIEAVQINYIKVPAAVRNDSRHPVVLDCNYSLRPDDVNLVVKWFLNEERVYQWVPPEAPQAFGRMKGRLNLTYTASDDPNMTFRAMKIINPTTDIAGEYKCFVSTFADEDFTSKNMIVFVPQSSLQLLRANENDEFVNFTCFASEVYPEPKVVIYKNKQDDTTNRYSLESVQWVITKLKSGRYSVLAKGSSRLDRLNPGSLIHCELKIPGTGYTKRTSMVYYPINLDNSYDTLRNNTFMMVMLLVLTTLASI